MNKKNAIKFIEEFIKDFDLNTNKKEREALLEFLEYFPKIDKEKHLKQFDYITNKETIQEGCSHLDGFDRAEMIINMCNIINEHNNQDIIYNNNNFIYLKDISSYINRDLFYEDLNEYESFEL